MKEERAIADGLLLLIKDADPRVHDFNEFMHSAITAVEYAVKTGLLTESIRTKATSKAFAVIREVEDRDQVDTLLSWFQGVLQDGEAGI